MGGGQGGADEWEAFQDDDGDTYYVNTLTQETSWDRPANFKEGGGGSADASPAADSPKAAENGGWEAVKDDVGDIYYWNASSGETTWDKPAGFTG